MPSRYKRTALAAYFRKPTLHPMHQSIRDGTGQLAGTGDSATERGASGESKLAANGGRFTTGPLLRDHELSDANTLAVNHWFGGDDTPTRPAVQGAQVLHIMAPN